MAIVDFVVIANKKSRGFRDKYRRRLLRIFAGRREAPVFYLPLKDDMFQGVEDNIQNVKKIIIAGGDGTFESALNYPYLQKKSLGFFPLGAGNSFYAYFYKGKRFEYLRSRFDFQEKELDVLEIEWEDENEKGKKEMDEKIAKEKRTRKEEEEKKNIKKRETLFLAVGVDAEVARLMKNRSRHGFFDYVGGSWRALLNGKSNYNFEIEIDGTGLSKNNYANITFGKVPYYGYNIRSMLGTIPANDGFIYGVGCLGKNNRLFNRLLRLWSLILLRFKINKFPLTTLKGKEILVKNDELFSIQAGGEFLGYSKRMKVRVKRRQKVLVI